MSSTASAHALVVEDDPDTSDWLHRRLEQSGFLPHWARTVPEAMSVLQERGDEITCLVLDLGLPQGTGNEILRHIREKNLPIKVAVVTGLGDGEALSDAVLLKPDAFFQKPVDATELVIWLKASGPGKVQ